MNKQQKRIVLNFAIVIVITITAAFGMVEMKNWVNHSEATRAMEHLWRVVSEYKHKNGSLPSQSSVDSIKGTLEGKARLGNLYYRALWIQMDSPPDTILACATKNYHSFFYKPGAIVLRLDGRIEWMDMKQFEETLAKQQTTLELEMKPK